MKNTYIFCWWWWWCRWFFPNPLAHQICRPLKNVSVLVLCRSFSHVSSLCNFLCVSSAAVSIALLLVLTHFYTYYLLLLNWFLFFLLFLLLSVFFRLLGIRRTILRHLGCFRRNVFNGFDPKLVCNIARPIYSHKRSVKVRKMFTVFFFLDHQRRTAVASQQKRRQNPLFHQLSE